MLLITRRTNESVVINGSIEITVVEVRGGRVKLGFNYPEGNSVYRKELFLKIQEENQTAAQSVGSLDKILQKLGAKKQD